MVSPTKTAVTHTSKSHNFRSHRRDGKAPNTVAHIPLTCCCIGSSASHSSCFASVRHQSPRARLRCLRFSPSNRQQLSLLRCRLHETWLHTQHHFVHQTLPVRKKKNKVKSCLSQRYVSASRSVHKDSLPEMMQSPPDDKKCNPPSQHKRRNIRHKQVTIACHDICEVSSNSGRKHPTQLVRALIRHPSD